MDWNSIEFKPDESTIPPDLKAKMDETEAILREKWKREKSDEDLVYEIRVNSQLLVICGRERGEELLQRLKELRISGSYKIRRRDEYDDR